MRKRLKNLKHKSGHSENGSPRQLIDETVYRSHMNNVVAHANDGSSPHWDPKYSGWSNPSRPRDFAIHLRGPVSPTGGIG
jgi:hypothetical protein